MIISMRHQLDSRVYADDDGRVAGYPSPHVCHIGGPGDSEPTLHHLVLANRPPVRRELRDMKRNHPKEWTLFLLGLEKFQNTDESHPLSWFQIAVEPYTNWPVQDWPKDADPSMKDAYQWQGFCTHSSILFLPWHRPYLALFETELRRHVKDAAEDYTDDEGRAAYIEAAKSFRLPYWDWALPADKDNGVVPREALIDAKHNIAFPNSRGVKKFARNPLASYKFGSEGTKDRNINLYSKVNGTVRWPNDDGTMTDEAGMNNKLLSFLTMTERLKSAPNNGKVYEKGKNLTERVLYLLQSYDSFGPISSNSFIKRNEEFESWGSLEDIHNSIHSLVGTGGHMNFQAVAAFDPIFWLHHANIDRLFAIWQAIWDRDGNAKDKYVTEQDAWPGKGSGGTFSNSWKSHDSIDTKLTPFTRSEDGTMWTSRDIRKTNTFGYVYPETQSWLHPTTADIFQKLKDTYPNASLANNIKADKDKALSFVTAMQQVEVPVERALADLVQGNQYLEWLVDIRAKKHTLGGNFVVHVFLGNPDDENSFLYIADPNHVAIFSTFGTDDTTGCQNCKSGQEAHLEVTGQIPLTLALVERYFAGKLDGITSDDVIPYLQKNLHWRVTDQSGVRGSRANVDGLLVSVVSNEVTLPDGPEALPQYAPNVHPWPAATTRENGEGRGRGTGLPADLVSV
ncbi:hypothetical protein BDV95DRAFT_632307 [Massariosphaeria phaeospora]|uniref:tyrosinase n=1 Tax=Massariosphaeria phaeospora TaxID=100035 RepID=A0A7C8M1Q1_9PLEO|nr:hypothetical protein BDV95DRAFT_632307 [Massariosphaeria phaeospora]